MKNVTVEMAGLLVSNDPESVLVTYALGSCIAVMLYDPVHCAAGMIHYMLPSSSVSPEKAREKPAMFGDVGVPMLFESMYKLGSRKQDLIVTVAGGAQVHDDEGVFNIGKRNYTVLRKLFWKNGVMIVAEDVGGTVSRTVYLDVQSGRVTVRTQGQESVLWGDQR